MADVPKLVSGERLKDAFPKINQAIDNANEAKKESGQAKTESNQALNVANQANSTAGGVQNQLDTLIIESGTSDAETLQARTDSNNTTFASLKVRLDSRDAMFEEVALNVKKFGVKGDGVTDDTAKLQVAFNYAIANKKDLYIGSEILVNGTIDIVRATGDRDVINVRGSGSLIKNNAGDMFSSSGTNRNGGNIRFSGGLTFKSTAGAGTRILNGAKLIRIYFDNVNFLNVDSLLVVPRTNVFPYDYIQTIYLSDCTVVGGIGYFINTYTAYDVSFLHSVMEHRDAGFNIELFHSVRIMDSVIEGMDGRVFMGVSGRNLIISDNYMEANARVTNQPYIEFQDFSTVDVNSASVTIQDNLIIGSPEQQENINYYAIKFKTLFTNLIIGGNSCDVNLYQVTLKHTITPEFLKVAYRERIERSGRFCVNTRPSQPVILGGQSLLRDVRIPFLETVGTVITNTGINKVADVAANVTLSTTSELAMLLRVVNATAQAGFSTRKVKLSSSTKYVIGISGYTRKRSGAQPTTIVKVMDSSNNVVWSTSLDWENKKDVGKLDDFHSLTPFEVSNTGEYCIQVELDPTDGLIPADSGLYISGLTVQAGTIASNINSYKMESAWNGEHLMMGNYSLWIDGNGKLRVKNGRPTNDADGTIVGTQV
ncbi:hypothetical protein [Fictibacillus nanhaiensis]|uniref:hypothetical protein n=1 Tax=Fictibacillus nanhaiensis TaxID=742169 RepID=UPI003C199FD3